MALAVPKVVAVPAPPQPMEQKVTVKRGGSVEVPLKIYGTRAQTLSWIIKQEPVRGKLSAMRATGAESAVVTYWPPADLGVVADRFTFSVRSKEGVSAPVEVTIAIADDAPQIVGPGELNFGSLLVGASRAKMLEFSNSGGGFAEGSFEVGAPWKVEGLRDYKLAPGEKRAVKIVFAPEQRGKFESQVTFTSQADVAVVLHGVAEEALVVAPTDLVLAQDAGRRLRAGSMEIRNNTDHALEVEVSASPRLIFKNSLSLAAHGVATLALQTAETDVAALEDTLRFSSGAYAVRLPVTAKALPALVGARPENVVFQKGTANAKERVFFENRGGMEAKVVLSVGAPFAVEESRFALAPGAEKEVAISLKTESVAGSRAILKVDVDGGGFEISVVAGGRAETESAPAGPRVAKISAVRVEQEESEVSEPPSASVEVPPMVVDSITGNSARVRWKGAWPNGVEFRCFQRLLSLDDDGDLVVNFREYSACKFSREDGANVVNFENLEQDQEYFFRIDEVSASTPKTVLLTQFHTLAPPVRGSFFSLTRVLIAFALVLGGFSVWNRIRMRSGSGF